MDENNLQNSTVLSLISPTNFVGRANEIEHILNFAKSEERNKSLLVLSAPAVGLSELLRQCFDRLFLAQGEIIPIYFAFPEDEHSA